LASSASSAVSGNPVSGIGGLSLLAVHVG